MVRSTARTRWSTLLADPAFAPFDLILLDPPYDHPAGETLAGVGPFARAGGVGRAGTCATDDAARATPDASVRARDLRSGDSALAIYTCPH